MKRLLLLVLLLVLVLPAPAASASPGRPGCLVGPSEAAVCPPVVVVGIGGLRWDDVGEQTPVLQRLARSGAVGALSVKALPELTCWADGWLTLGAGARAEAVDGAVSSCGSDLPTDLREVERRNLASRDAARIGALHDALARASGTQPVAEGPGARVAFGWAPDPAVGGFDEAVLSPRLVLLDGGLLSERDRSADLQRADAALGRRLARLPPESHVLVVGLSEADGGTTAHLHVAIATGPRFASGSLVSASTRRAPYVQLVDVAPTVLDLLGEAAPAAMDGEPWQVQARRPSPAALADLDDLAVTHKRVTVPFFVALLGGQLALLLLAAWRRRAGLAELVALGGVAALGASYLANLLPWWRAPLPLPALLCAVVLLAVPVVGLARRAPGTAGPAGVVCAFTAGVLVLDLVTGAHLQMSSVAGYSPLVAGRFAGIGNVAFGVLAAAALLATAALARRLLLVAAIAVLVVAVDGAPPWGSDVGGVLALVPAFALLAVLLSGRRVSLLLLGLSGLAGAAVVTGFALADWSRAPQDRTHLGRFVQDVADGTAGTLLRRKAEAVLALLFASPVTALLPLVVAAAVLLVVRPPAPLAQALQAAPAWRAGLLATGLASGIGFAANDSGAAVPAMALTVAVPATLAVVLRARRTRHDPPALLA